MCFFEKKRFSDFLRLQNVKNINLCNGDSSLQQSYFNSALRNYVMWSLCFRTICNSWSSRFQRREGLIN